MRNWKIETNRLKTSRAMYKCADSNVFESGSNPVLQIFNPNPLRIRYQHDTSNPTPIWLRINTYHASKQQHLCSKHKLQNQSRAVSAKKISLLILLEAKKVQFQKTKIQSMLQTDWIYQSHVWTFGKNDSDSSHSVTVWLEWSWDTIASQRDSSLSMRYLGIL